MAVVNNIRELRKSRGTVQKDIAVKTGFSARTVRAVDRGERDPSAEFMLRVAAYLTLWLRILL